MSKKLVHVTYSGEIAQAMHRTFGNSNDDLREIVDVRFQPFVMVNEDMIGAEKVTVDVNKWVIDLRFRQKADNGNFMAGRFNSALDVNAYLTILSHFGLDAEYSLSFVQRCEPMISEILLHSFRIDNGEHINARDFHGVTYIRGEFFRQFDDFFLKYGL